VPWRTVEREAEVNMNSWTQHAQMPNDRYDSNCIGERFRSHPSSSSASGTRRARCSPHRLQWRREGRDWAHSATDCCCRRFKFQISGNYVPKQRVVAETRNRAELGESGNNWLFHNPESSTRVRFWKQLVVSQSRIQHACAFGCSRPLLGS
jgi:hypothetical protein